MNQILSFDGEQRFLSNFWPCEIHFEGLTFQSVEAAYQAAKTDNLQLRLQFQSLEAKTAKHKGKSLELRKDWLQVREQVMEQLIIEKFKIFNLRVSLLQTGKSELIEGNYWHDNFWGVCSCVRCQSKGANMLGKILMKVRENIREQGTSNLRGKHFAGIGSRETPPEVLKLLTDLTFQLCSRGLILRSGGAVGADAYCELGARNANSVPEIYLPWPGFNGLLSGDGYRTIADDRLPDAMRIAEQYHPNWASCSYGAKKMHTRNVAQILGGNLDTPSLFVLCWAPVKEGRVQGGTGQAVRIAQALAIPVFNLFDPGATQKLRQFLLEVMCR